MLEKENPLEILGTESGGVKAEGPRREGERGRSVCEKRERESGGGSLRAV